MFALGAKQGVAEGCLLADLALNVHSPSGTWGRPLSIDRTRARRVSSLVGEMSWCWGPHLVCEKRPVPRCACPPGAALGPVPPVP